jgi:hypothetical protein
VDVKQVKKGQQEEEDQKRAKDFKWDLMGEEGKQ